MIKADIIHIAGFDTYNDTHESGNYILFDFMRKLKYDSKMILCLEKLKNDPDTYFVPKEFLFEVIESCKVLIIHDQLLNASEIREIHKKTNCKILKITQTHYHLMTENTTGHDCHPELNDVATKIYNSKFLKEKKAICDELPITIVYGSSYTGRITEEYEMYNNLIQLPLPLEVPYNPMSKLELKKIMFNDSTEDVNKKFIFWGSSHPHTERKGKILFDKVLDLLWDKLNIEEQKQIGILNVGPSAGRFGKSSKFDIYRTGYLHTRQKMASAYKLCDVAVNTTIADAGPMMISEAMCNETPVIAFDRSIACDLCIDGETGYLIKNLNLQSMCDAIYDILFVDDIEKMSIQAREKYLEFHNSEILLDKWDTLIKKLIEDETQ